MSEFIKKLHTDNRARKAVSYIFFGVCTTLVNFLMFAFLKDVLRIELNTSNFIAVFTAVLFAYVTNKRFVFRSRTDTRGELLREAVSFFSARGVTMLIEIGAIFLIHTVFRVSEAYSLYTKAAINVFVLILNFIFSQWIVFRNRDAAKPQQEK